MAEILLLFLFSLSVAMALLVLAHRDLRQNPRAQRAGVMSLALAIVCLVFLAAYVALQWQIDPNYRWPLSQSHPQPGADR